MVSESFISCKQHGRILSEKADGTKTLVVGFHGYAENADIQLQRIKNLSPEPAHLCSIQGLHCFYKQKHIAASWMCSQNREQSISDNIHYINQCLDHLQHEMPWDRLIYCGFSQGAAMAYRAAIFCKHPPLALLINGGDIPPEISVGQLGSLPPTCIIRGSDDHFYNAEKLAADQKRLVTTRHEIHQPDMKHDWEPHSRTLFKDFLKRVSINQI